MKKKAKIIAAALIIIIVLVTAIILISLFPIEKETYLKIGVFDRGGAGLELNACFQSEYIKNAVKKDRNINVEFVPIPRDLDAETFNVLMASNSAPDLYFTYERNALEFWIDRGELTDLSPALEKHGKKLKAYLGEETLRYGVWSGAQFAIPAKRPNTAKFSEFIRKDWLDRLGLELPATVDEFYETLKAFREQIPAQNGEDIVPFAVKVDENDIESSVHNLLWSFVRDMPEEEFAARFGPGRWTLPGFKDGVRFLNALYNEGLISGNFDWDRGGRQFESDIVEGRIGFFVGDYDTLYRPGGLADRLKKNDETALFEPCDPFNNYKGEHVKQRGAPNGLYLVVPAFASGKAETAIKYLNWMSSDPEIIKVLQNGEFGKQYLTEVEGFPANRIENEFLINDLKISPYDFAIVSAGLYEYGSPEENAMAISLNYPGYEDFVREAIEIGYKDSFLAPRFETQIKAEIEYLPVIIQKGRDIFVKSIKAHPSDFDIVYDRLVSEYLDMGGQAVIEEKRTAYLSAHNLWIR